MKVIKRDGRRLEFNPRKIYLAVYKACEAIDYVPEESDKVAHSVMQRAAKAIEDKCEQENRKSIRVEEIQDIIVSMLIRMRNVEVSECYITYREKRNQERNRKTALNQTIEEITYAGSKDSDVKRDNGNVNGDSAMGMMLQYGSAVTKDFTDNNLLSEKVKKAVVNGDIYIHDKDFYPMGTLTCCQIPLDKLFKDGFDTGHGAIREPQNIQTYAALAAIAIQSNQNDHHGGQAIPLFDFYLAPGVTKSLKKNFKQTAQIYLEAQNKTSSIISSFLTFLNSLSLEEWKIANKEALLRKMKDWMIEHNLNTNTQETLTSIYNKSLHLTDKQTYQAMEGFVHNLNTMHSRAGAQVPFSSINFGMDTSEEGRMVSKNLMLAQEAGMGNGETPIFPILIFQVKEGVNYNPEDPNYDLFKLSLRVSAKRLFPNYVFVDAPFNLQYYDPQDPETIIATMGCVDGNEVVAYKINHHVYIQSFKDMWTCFSKLFKLGHSGQSEYFDLLSRDDIRVSIMDTKSKDFVECRILLRNPDKGDWMKITIQDKIGKQHTLIATSDHPLPVKNKGRIFVKDLKLQDEVYLTRQNHTELVACPIVNIEILGYRNEYSYDVTTESDYFDVSGILSHNCRTRVIGNVNGKQTPVGRGNLSFSTINLPRLGIKHGVIFRNEHGIESSSDEPLVFDGKGFLEDFDVQIDLCIEQILERYQVQRHKYVKNFPFLMGQHIWRGSENLFENDELGDVIDQGTLSIGFIGLAECLVALTGHHHGEIPVSNNLSAKENMKDFSFSNNSSAFSNNLSVCANAKEVNELGYAIIYHLRQRMEEATKKYHLNFSVLATPKLWARV